MNKELQTFINGFTYSGSVKHSIINYVLILITLLPHILTAGNQASKGNKWYGALFVSLFVQILLWFSFNAVGVSVIWCSMAGFNLLSLRSEHHSRKNKIVLIVSLLASLLGILYYAITLPVITTVAHTIAVFMGIGLFYLWRYLHGRRTLQ